MSAPVGRSTLMSLKETVESLSTNLNATKRYLLGTVAVTMVFSVAVFALTVAANSFTKETKAKDGSLVSAGSDAVVATGASMAERPVADLFAADASNWLPSAEYVLSTEEGSNTLLRINGFNMSDTSATIFTSEGDITVSKGVSSSTTIFHKVAAVSRLDQSEGEDKSVTNGTRVWLDYGHTVKQLNVGGYVQQILREFSHGGQVRTGYYDSFTKTTKNGVGATDMGSVFLPSFLGTFKLAGERARYYSVRSTTGRVYSGSMTDYVYFIANRRCCGYRMYTSVLLLHGQSGSSFLGIHHHVPRRSDKYFHPFCKWSSSGKCNAGSYVSYEGRAWKLTDEASYSSYYSFWFAPTCPSRGGKRSGYYANSVVNGPVFDSIADSFFNAEGNNNVYGTARRGVMGHSMGGYGALKFSLFYSIYNLNYVACANGATVPDSQSFYSSDYGAKCGRKCMCPEGFSHSGARCYSIGRARGTSTELFSDEMTTSTLSFFLGGIRCVRKRAGGSNWCNFYRDQNYTTFGSQYYNRASLQYGSGNNVHYNRSALGWSFNDGTGMKNIWATYSDNSNYSSTWYNFIMDIGSRTNGDLPYRTGTDLKCSKDAWDGCGAGASKSSKIMDSIDSGHWLKAFIAGTGCSSSSYFYIEGDRYDGIYGTNKRMHDAARSLLRANGCYRVYRFSSSSGGHWLGLFRKFAALSRFAAGKRCNAYCSTSYCRCSYRGYMGASTYWWHNCRFFHGNAPPAVRLMLNDCDANVGKEKSSYVSGCYHNMCPISHEKQNAFIDEITKQAKGKLRDFQTKNWSKSWYRKANSAFWDAWNNSIKAANKVTTKTEMSGSGSAYNGKRIGRKLQSSRIILASLNAGSMGVFGVSDEFALGRDFGSASATSFTFTGFGARTGISTTPGGNVGSNMCASAFKACAIFSWGPVPRVCRPHDYCYNKYSCDSYGSWCAQWGPNNCKKFSTYCRLVPQ